jgi:hypothetical protein
LPDMVAGRTVSGLVPGVVFLHDAGFLFTTGHWTTHGRFSTDFESVYSTLCVRYDETTMRRAPRGAQLPGFQERNSENLSGAGQETTSSRTWSASGLSGISSAATDDGLLGRGLFRSSLLSGAAGAEDSSLALSSSKRTSGFLRTKESASNGSGPRKILTASGSLATLGTRLGLSRGTETMSCPDRRPPNAGSCHLATRSRYCGVGRISTTPVGRGPS